MAIIKQGTLKQDTLKQGTLRQSGGSDLGPSAVHGAANGAVRRAIRIISESPETREEIPFVPAMDLFEKERSKLTPEQVAAIALAVFMQTSDPSEQNESAWLKAARVAALR